MENLADKQTLLKNKFLFQVVKISAQLEDIDDVELLKLYKQSNTNYKHIECFKALFNNDKDLIALLNYILIVIL